MYNLIFDYRWNIIANYKLFGYYWADWYDSIELFDHQFSLKKKHISLKITIYKSTKMQEYFKYFIHIPETSRTSEKIWHYICRLHMSYAIYMYNDKTWLDRPWTG